MQNGFYFQMLPRQTVSQSYSFWIVWLLKGFFVWQDFLASCYLKGINALQKIKGPLKTVQKNMSSSISSIFVSESQRHSNIWIPMWSSWTKVSGLRKSWCQGEIFQLSLQLWILKWPCFSQWRITEINALKNFFLLVDIRKKSYWDIRVLRYHHSIWLILQHYSFQILECL